MCVSVYFMCTGDRRSRTVAVCGRDRDGFPSVQKRAEIKGRPYNLSALPSISPPPSLKQTPIKEHSADGLIQLHDGSLLKLYSPIHLPESVCLDASFISTASETIHFLSPHTVF